MESPKRKRDNSLPTPDSSPVTFDTSIKLPPITSAEVVPGSPRTRVAQSFQHLALNAPEVKKLEFTAKPALPPTTNGKSSMRKRVKLFGDSDMEIDSTGRTEIPETPQKQKQAFEGVLGEQNKADTSNGEMGKEIKLHNEFDPVVFRAGLGGLEKKGALGRAYPSINRLADSKSRGRKRVGTPPLSKSMDAGNENGMMEIVDADRAALTWHDDEITGHDATDPDDDGEGINGIGFRPTPAMAYARAERRRQQMADYRSREAREARAKRSERRRGNESAKVQQAAMADADTAARRVRFLETEIPAVIFTS